MIETKVVFFNTALEPLCETYSTDGMKLRQEETGTVYGSSVIDLIAGYIDGDLNKPFSRYTYTETDEKDESEAYADESNSEIYD